MGIPHYLAMTAAELSAFAAPTHTAWMACHFSPYHSGLSNLPQELPPGSLLILDDSVPMGDHDPALISSQLLSSSQTLGCTGVLLDFQRPGNGRVQELAQYIIEALPCPVAVSRLYAKDLDCPVFLPPCPLHSSLESYLAPWKGRDIWLETALDAETLTLTEAGCQISPVSELPENGFADAKLHCHYRAEILEDTARFTLWRTREDLEGLLAEAEALSITAAVGLWQEQCFSM